MKRTILLLFMSMQLFALNIQTDGLLDDDIFIYSITKNSDSHTMIYAGQMHNPSNKIYFNGKIEKTIPLSGEIDLNKEVPVKNDVATVVVLSNEREEINPRYTLRKRSHYRSPSVKINGKILLEEYLPSKKTKNWFPTWFGDLAGVKECKCNSEGKIAYGEDFFVIWENATVQIGLILPKPGTYELFYINEKSNSMIFKTKVDVSTAALAVKMYKEGHDFIESTGYLFNKEDNLSYNIDETLSLSPTKIIARDDSGGIFVIPLLYPWPYLNQLVVMSAK